MSGRHTPPACARASPNRSQRRGNASRMIEAKPRWIGALRAHADKRRNAVHRTDAERAPRRSGYDADDHAIRSFASLTSISSAVSLSFQSAFHLSLAVLFCYWILARI